MREEVKKKLEEFGLKVELVSKGQVNIDSKSEEGLSLRIAKGNEYHIKSGNATFFVVHLDDRTVDVMQKLRFEDLDGLKQFNEMVELCLELLDMEAD